MPYQISFDVAIFVISSVILMKKTQFIEKISINLGNVN